MKNIHILPKEEPKCTCKEHDPYCCQVHGTCPTCVKQEELKQECTCENPTDNTCDYCEKQNKIEILEEAKKRALEEELEEAANRLFPISKGGSMWMPSTHDCNQANKQEGFIVGAKYMAERMYSEEDLRNAYRWGTTVNNGTKEHFNEWLKKFKKK
jgi:hypothetical protein